MSSEAGLLSPAHRRVSIAIYTTVALIAFEGTSVAAALPEIAADLGSIDLLPWVITSFLFVLALSTVISGPLVDAWGSQVIFTWSALVFAISGCAAGFAGDLPTMIAVRIVQGAASGVLFAATIVAVNLAFPDRLTGRAFAANSTIWGVMGAAAPAIAAVLLNVASWRWIFFVNLPLGALALVAGRGRLPGRQPGAEPASIDGRGVLLLVAFTAAVTAAVDQLGWQSFVLLGIGIATAALYVRHARIAERPVVSLSHIAVEPYRSLAVVPSVMLLGAFCTTVFVTVYVTAGRGWSAGAAAWSALFFTIGWTVGANASSRLLDRRPPREIMVAGFVFGLAGAIVAAVGVVANGPLWILFVGLTVEGIGIGLATNASLVMLREATDPGQIGRASAANQFLRSQGFTLGAAAGGAILLFVVNGRLGSADPVQQLLAGEQNVTDPDVAAAVRVGFAAVTVTSVVVWASVALPLVSLWRAAVRRRATAGV